MEWTSNGSESNLEGGLVRGGRSLSGAQVTLLDYNASAVSTALEVHRSIGLEPEAIQGDLFDLPEDLLGAFDLVCSFGTMEHFAGDKRRQVFAACTSLLRPGGLLFFTVPNRFGIFCRVAFGTRKRLALVPRDFYEQPYSRLELLRLARASEMKNCRGRRSRSVGQGLRLLGRRECQEPSAKTGTSPPAGEA